jgi:hypothetical protein
MARLIRLKKPRYTVEENTRNANKRHYPWVVMCNTPTCTSPVAFVATKEVAELYMGQLNNKGYLEICAW